MKKIAIFLLIVLLITLALVACDNTSKKEPDIVVNKSADEYSMGSWDANIYANSFLKIKFKKPDDWNIISTEELSQMYSSIDELADKYSINKDDLADKEKLKEFIENNEVSYFKVQNPETYSTIEAMTYVVSDDMTVNSFLSNIKEGLENNKIMYFYDIQIGKGYLCGREFDTITYKSDYAEGTVTQTVYCERKSNLIEAIQIMDFKDDVKVDEVFLKY